MTGSVIEAAHQIRLRDDKDQVGVIAETPELLGIFFVHPDDVILLRRTAHFVSCLFITVDHFHGAHKIRQAALQKALQWHFLRSEDHFLVEQTLVALKVARLEIIVLDTALYAKHRRREADNETIMLLCWGLLK